MVVNSAGFALTVSLKPRSVGSGGPVGPVANGVGLIGSAWARDHDPRAGQWQRLHILRQMLRADLAGNACRTVHGRARAALAPAPHFRKDRLVTVIIVGSYFIAQNVLTTTKFGAQNLFCRAFVGIHRMFFWGRVVEIGELSYLI